MRTLLLLIFIFITLPTFANKAKVAIIIDDIGYRKSDIQALSLPGNITYAILPHTPFGKQLAQQANYQNNEVIVHMPMEALNGKKLGPGALTTQMNEQLFRQELADAFSDIPFAKGMNNHMGSKLTQLHTPMEWTMRFLKERNLFFVDSVTTQQSKAEEIAESYGVPNAHRHIFLDNHLSKTYIEKQFKQLVRHAKKHKRVIAIAHPHPETITALTELLPTLSALDISLVPISQLIKDPSFSEETTLKTDD